MTSGATGTRIGFIGCGAMARALAGGLVKAGASPEHIVASDPIALQREAFQKTVGSLATDDNAEVVAGSDVVVLAVKPGAVESVLRELAASSRASQLARPLWVSIAAGIPIAALSMPLPDEARIVRSMPNTPALVGAGATALCANERASDGDVALAESLFQAVGTTWLAPREDLLDAVTGLSGSGPAYIFLILEALGDAGVRVGLPRDAAYQLAFQTVYGAAKLAIDSGQHPAQLKDQVTSPGGTTIAGLEALEVGGVRAALYQAVAAATRRSRELSDT
jgi:pyrroline-5-carboxylate reductase